MRILIADDENLMREFTVKIFEKRGFLVKEARTIEEIYKLLFEGDFDLLLLDRNFTDEGEDAINLVEEVRKKKCDVPILILSAIKGSRERSFCLDMGADDYLEKPYDPIELIARAEALLRRRNRKILPKEIGNFSINNERREIYLKNRPLKLKLREFQLLRHFLYNPNRVITEREILERVWNDDELSTRSNTINVHLMRIRKALGNERKRLETLRGTGFMFNMDL